MRFKRGINVEVLSDSGGPLGSWMCCEIVNGNGRHYTVRYHPNVSSRGEAKLGRVAKNCMRPSPPVVSVKRWAPGDIVEVRRDVCWKLASVVQAIDEENYLVKFMGYSQELKARKCEIRPRIVWQDEKWVIIGKTFKRASPYSYSGITRRKLKIRRQAIQAQPAENNCMQQTFNVGTPDHHNLLRETPTHEFNDSNTIASSVGSCSYPLNCLDIAALTSDADSLWSRGVDDGMFNMSSDATLAADRYR